MVICKLGINRHKYISNSNLPNKCNKFHLYSVSIKITEPVYGAQTKEPIYSILEIGVIIYHYN